MASACQRIAAILAVAVGLVAGCSGSPGEITPVHAPLWTVDRDDLGSIKRIVATAVRGDFVVIEADDSVSIRVLLVLNRSNGAVVWGLRLIDDRVEAVSQDAVIVDGPRTTVYDLATGKPRWDEAGVLAATADALIASDCDGLNETCTLWSRELSTGEVIWSLEFEDHTVPLRLSDASHRRSSEYGTGAAGLYQPWEVPYLLMEPVDRRHVTVVDAVTGTKVREITRDSDASFFEVLASQRGGEVAGGLLLDISQVSDCHGTVTGYELLTGKQVWQYDLTGPRDDLNCKTFRSTDDRLFSLDDSDRPLLLDATSGEPLWRGPMGTLPLGADDRSVAVARSAELGFDDGVSGLAGFALSSGEQVWSVSLPAGASDGGTLIDYAVIDHSLVYSVGTYPRERYEVGGFTVNDNTVVVVDLASGDLEWVAPGTHDLVVADSGYVVTVSVDPDPRKPWTALNLFAL